MAPLPDNLTRRVYFDYISSSVTLLAKPHTCMWRDAFDLVDAGAAAIQAKFLSFLQAYTVAGFWTGWQVVGVRVSEGNTDFSVPVPIAAGLAAFIGTGVTGAAPVSAAAIEQVWLGRSPLTGVRTRFSLYGRAVPQITDFRDSSSAQTIAAVGILNAAVAPRLVAADNTVATWYPYANLNYNSYWESELRS